MKNSALLFLSFLFLFTACQNNNNPSITKEEANQQQSANPEQAIKKAAESSPKYIKAIKVKSPKLDGYPYEAHWKNSKWLPIDQLWLGEAYEKEDFSGHYKVAWSEDYIYLLVQIVDDVFRDEYQDGLKQYWDDDCVEIFIDEDQSGGDHQYNHNAFAYHVAKDSRVVDMGTDKKPHYYSEHILTSRTQAGSVYTWEMAMLVYTDQYVDDSDRNIPIKLTAGKKMGFAMAYCDSDYGKERENFIGSIPIAGEDKNRGWIDASVFGVLELVE